MKKKTKHLLIGCGALVLTLGAVGGIVHLTRNTNVIDKMMNPRKGEIVATIENVVEDEDGKEKNVPLFTLDGEELGLDSWTIKGLNHTMFTIGGKKESLTINQFSEFYEKSYTGMDNSISDREKRVIWGNITATGEDTEIAYGSQIGLEIPQFVTKKDLPKDEETYDVVAEMSYFDTIRVNYSINHNSYVEYGSANYEDVDFESAINDYKYLNKDTKLFMDFDVMKDGHFFYNEQSLQVFGLGGFRDIDIEVNSIELVRKDKDNAKAHLYLIEDVVTGGGQSMSEGADN